jgi:CxxC motif-containing protein
LQQITCIVCPNGCRISAEIVGGDYVFSGNKCARGIEFARAELTAPMRSVTTTVKTVFPQMPALPVRTKGEIPKELIPAFINALASVLVTQQVGIGETVVSDILGTGCDVIATSDILKSSAFKEERLC